MCFKVHQIYSYVGFFEEGFLSNIFCLVVLLSFYFAEAQSTIRSLREEEEKESEEQNFLPLI